MTNGVIQLGEVAARLRVIEIACGRCPRRGRLGTATLLAQHGPAMPLPALLRLLVADCPRRDGTTYERCDPHVPNLIAVFSDKPAI